MAQRTGWPRGRTQWIFGAIALLIVGALIGAVLNNIWLGLTIGVLISIGWLIAYESWRGNNNRGVNDESNGIEL